MNPNTAQAIDHLANAIKNLAAMEANGASFAFKTTALSQIERARRAVHDVEVPPRDTGPAFNPLGDMVDRGLIPSDEGADYESVFSG